MNINVLSQKFKQSGMTVREVCAQAEITTPTFYEMLKRNNTTAGHLEKLARVLRFPVQDFFDEDVRLNYTPYNSVTEPHAEYGASATKEIKNVGTLIEERMKRIKFSVKDLADATGTTTQNISQMLGRKSIAFDKAVEINSILNPPGSIPWDLFSYYSMSTSKSIEQRYIELLEEHKTLQSNYLKLLEKTKK